MKIKDIGGEIGLIKRISCQSSKKEVLIGIGDDAAVIKNGKKKLVVTTDMLVENDHFSTKYFTPKQIGIKAMESNASDIAAMGAIPLYAFVSLCLKKNTSVEFVDGLYRGIYQSAKKHKIDILGGDTTHGQIMAINIAMIGKAGKKVCLRSNAKTKDLIFVTGKLGASTAGLKLLRKKINGFDYVKKKHLEPKARTDLSQKISKIANAMEDVSDGLASEIRNICLASNKGAIIFAEKIPIAIQTKKAANKVKENALDYALFGGEDFEIVFTVSEKFKKKAQKLGTQVGQITNKNKIFLQEKNKKTELKKFGFDHFS